MDARYLHAPLIVAALLSLAANARTENFIVTAATPELAHEVAQQAERYRRDLALEWLGRELPPWQDKCPITVHVAPNRGAGGETSFVFVQGQPRSWRMIVEGSRERVLDSVLPHEVTHTILATHFGCPLPRWADEGACTTVEHTSERQKQDRLLIQFLTTSRGIAFNKMFAMRDYPPDILPLYSQGYSLARFLIAQGGKQKFIAYVGDGLRWNNWTKATHKHYGYTSLSELQLTWVDWVRSGSPADIPRKDELIAANQQPARPQPDATRLASATQPPATPPQTSPPSAPPATALTSAAPTQTVPAPSAPAASPRAGQVNAAPRAMPNPTALASASPVRGAAAPQGHGGWYARQRDLASSQRTGQAPRGRSSDPYEPVVRVPANGAQSSSRPAGMQQPGQVVLEWSRGGAETLQR